MSVATDGNSPTLTGKNPCFLCAIKNELKHAAIKISGEKFGR